MAAELACMKDSADGKGRLSRAKGESHVRNLFPDNKKPFCSIVRLSFQISFFSELAQKTLEDEAARSRSSLLHLGTRRGRDAEFQGVQGQNKIFPIKSIFCILPFPPSFVWAILVFHFPI